MKLLRQFLFLLCVAAFLNGATAADIADLKITKEEGFVDLDFTLADARPGFATALTGQARGKLNGEIVGFSIDILNNWKPQTNGNYTVYWGRVRFRSLGSESDKFVALLARLYGVKLDKAAMAPQVEFQAVSLEGDPMSPKRGPVKMKLFFEGKSESTYAEVYTNVDLNRGRLEFHEKDSGYRSAVIGAFRKGT